MTTFYKSISKVVATGVIVAATTSAFAQGDAAVLLRAGQADANALFNGYMGPLMKSFGAGLNSGWFQTAKPHGIGGFDITVSANLTFAPTADQSFSLNGLQKVRPQAGQPDMSPTIFGSGDASKIEVIDKSPFTGNDTAIAQFDLPEGIGTNIFAVPTAQLSVGVGFGTDIAIRFVPSLSLGDAGIGLFGFAVKHDFKQWIPGMKDLPFDMSAMFGYTTMSSDVKFSGSSSLKPQQDSNIYNPDPSKNYNNQKAEFKSSAWTANVIISKKLGPFTPYVGLGYQNASTDLKILGDYPVTVPNSIAQATNPLDPSFGKPARIEEIKDPVTISGDISGFRANAGFRLKLAVLTFHADYTFGEYRVISAGIGLNLQSIAPFKL
jgi:opacity protein-like surface antigen